MRCAASWRCWFDELAGVGLFGWELRWAGHGRGAPKSTTELEVLALGGSERRFEPSEFGVVVALELGELRGERAQDVALRRRLVGLGIARDGRGALLAGAELLNLGAER